MRRELKKRAPLQRNATFLEKKRINPALQKREEKRKHEGSLKAGGQDDSTTKGKKTKATS